MSVGDNCTLDNRESGLTFKRCETNTYQNALPSKGWGHGGWVPIKMDGNCKNLTSGH